MSTIPSRALFLAAVVVLLASSGLAHAQCQGRSLQPAPSESVVRMDTPPYEELDLSFATVPILIGICTYLGIALLTVIALLLREFIAAARTRSPFALLRPSQTLRPVPSTE